MVCGIFPTRAQTRVPCIGRWILNHCTTREALKSLLSDVGIATPAFFWFQFAWNNFFHPLTFSLYVSLGLKWFPCRQHIYGPFFVSIQPVYAFWLEHWIHLHLRSLLMCMFLLPFSWLFWICFCWSSSFLLFSIVVWWLSLVLCFGCFFFCVCVSIVVFWFAGRRRFRYSSLYMYKVVLCCWSLSFKCNSHFLHLYSPLLMAAGFNIIFVCGWFPTVTLCFPLPVRFSTCDFLVSSSALFLPPTTPTPEKFL